MTQLVSPFRNANLIVAAEVHPFKDIIFSVHCRGAPSIDRSLSRDPVGLQKLQRAYRRCDRPMDSLLHERIPDGFG